jgi:hypothetical protein
MKLTVHFVCNGAAEKCGNVSLQLEYLKLEIAEDAVDEIFCFYCPYCRRHFEVDREQVLEDVAIEIEGDDDGEPDDSVPTTMSDV